MFSYSLPFYSPIFAETAWSIDPQILLFARETEIPYFYQSSLLGFYFWILPVIERPNSLQDQSPMGKARYFHICCIWAWVWNTPNASRCGNLRIVWFCIENKRWTRVALSIAFSLEHREFNSTFSVSSLTSGMPSPDSIALLPSNRSYSTDVWYDKVAFFSTRGFVNIYHNAEWIANFYHIATNIEKFPLVWMNLLFELVLCIHYRQSCV